MSTGRLFLVVFSAVLLANVATLGIFEAWTRYQVGQLTDSLNAETERLFSDQRRNAEDVGKALEQAVRQQWNTLNPVAPEQSRAEEQAAAERKKEREQHARKARIERERATNAARISRETCATWRRFYEKEKTDFNRAMMQKSCQ